MKETKQIQKKMYISQEDNQPDHFTSLGSSNGAQHIQNEAYISQEDNQLDHSTSLGSLKGAYHIQHETHPEIKLVKIRMRVPAV